MADEQTTQSARPGADQTAGGGLPVIRRQRRPLVDLSRYRRRNDPRSRYRVEPDAEPLDPDDQAGGSDTPSVPASAIPTVEQASAQAAGEPAPGEPQAPPQEESQALPQETHQEPAQTPDPAPTPETPAEEAPASESEPETPRETPEDTTTTGQEPAPPPKPHFSIDGNDILANGHKVAILDQNGRLRCLPNCGSLRDDIDAFLRSKSAADDPADDDPEL